MIGMDLTTGKALSNKNYVVQHVFTLLSIRLESLVMRRNFGCMMFDFVDSKNNEFYRALIVSVVASCFTSFKYYRPSSVSFEYTSNSVIIKIDGFLLDAGVYIAYPLVKEMIINQYIFKNYPQYSGTQILQNPVFLLHFDGADGSTSFFDECGKTFSRCGVYESITADSPILGPGSLNLNFERSMVLSGLGIKTLWPSGLSMAGAFTISMKIKIPSDFYNPGQLWLFCSTTMLNGDPVFGAFFDEVGLRWYGGSWGVDDERITVLANSSFSVGSTYDLRFSRDSSGNLRAWVNGVQHLSTLIPDDYTKPNGTEICIGTSVHDKSLRTPAGLIDEFAWGLFSTASGNFAVTNKKWVLS